MSTSEGVGGARRIGSGWPNTKEGWRRSHGAGHRWSRVGAAIRTEIQSIRSKELREEDRSAFLIALVKLAQ